jgi:hypothetical protein
MAEKVLLRDYRDKALSWLMAIQDDGATTKGGWGQFENSEPSSLNTAEVIQVLVELGDPAHHGAIRDGVAYLEANQLTATDPHFPQHAGAWGRRVKGSKEGFRVPDVIRTSNALVALSAVRRANIAPVSQDVLKLGVAWLVRHHVAGGGWPFTPLVAEDTETLPTALAVEALLALRRESPDYLAPPAGATALRQGVNHLERLFPDDGTDRLPKGCLIGHGLHAVRVLRIAAADGIKVDESLLAAAKRAIDREADGIERFEDEKVTLGTGTTKHYSYALTHFNPALYLTTFGDEIEADDPIAARCLHAIRINRDPWQRGFGARRSLSWATARCISALHTVDGRIRQFPPPLSERGGGETAPPTGAGGVQAPAARWFQSPPHLTVAAFFAMAFTVVLGYWAVAPAGSSLPRPLGTVLMLAVVGSVIAVVLRLADGGKCSTSLLVFLGLLLLPLLTAFQIIPEDKVWDLLSRWVGGGK